MIRLEMMALSAILAASALVPAYAAPTLPRAGKAVLYNAAFKTHGLRGWHHVGSDTWKAKQGILSNRGGQSGEIVAPYSIGTRRDFRVRASVRVISGNSGEYHFGIDVQGTGQEPGVIGGYGVSPSNPLFTGPALVWGNEQVPGAGPALHSGYNTLQVDVRDHDVTLTVDGVTAIAFPVDGGQNGSRLGIVVAGAIIDVRSFTVSRLSPAVQLPAVPPLRRVNLGPSDVPSNLTETEYAFFQNAWTAHISGATAQDVSQTGLELSDQAGYFAPALPIAGPYGIFSDGSVYSSVAMAEVAEAHTLSSAVNAWSKFKNFSQSTVPGLGDAAQMMEFDTTDTDRATGDTFAATMVVIYFRRANYEYQLFVQFPAVGNTPGDMTTRAVDLARIIDARIQALS